MTPSTPPAGTADMASLAACTAVAHLDQYVEHRPLQEARLKLTKPSKQLGYDGGIETVDALLDLLHRVEGCRTSWHR